MMHWFLYIYQTCATISTAGIEKLIGSHMNWAYSCIFISLWLHQSCSSYDGRSTASLLLQLLAHVTSLRWVIYGCVRCWHDTSRKAWMEHHQGSHDQLRRRDTWRIVGNFNDWYVDTLQLYSALIILLKCDKKTIEKKTERERGVSVCVRMCESVYVNRLTILTHFSLCLQCQNARVYMQNARKGLLMRCFLWRGFRPTSGNLLALMLAVIYICISTLL